MVIVFTTFSFYPYFQEDEEWLNESFDPEVFINPAFTATFSQIRSQQDKEFQASLLIDQEKVCTFSNIFKISY